MPGPHYSFMKLHWPCHLSHRKFCQQYGLHGSVIFYNTGEFTRKDHLSITQPLVISPLTCSRSQTGSISNARTWESWLIHFLSFISICFHCYWYQLHLSEMPEPFLRDFMMFRVSCLVKDQLTSDLNLWSGREGWSCLAEHHSIPTFLLGLLKAELEIRPGINRSSILRSSS